jgi:hypothetical protein
VWDYKTKESSCALGRPEFDDEEKRSRECWDSGHEEDASDKL